MGGTALAKVTRLLGPTMSTAAAQYSGSRVTHDRVANPPYEPPTTPIRSGSTQSWARSHRTAWSRSRRSPPPQSRWISF